MKVSKFLYVLLIIICILLAANLWMGRYQIQGQGSQLPTMLNRWTGRAYIIEEYSMNPPHYYWIPIESEREE